jgi:DNA-binding transcriptional regulator YbjK
VRKGRNKAGERKEEKGKILHLQAFTLSFYHHFILNHNKVVTEKIESKIEKMSDS